MTRRKPIRHELTLTATLRTQPELRGVAIKAGLSRTNGWFHRFLSRIVPQFLHGGRLAQHNRDEVRVGHVDRYVERVEILDTGEVIHFVDEPLSDHQGHGSAKVPLG